jgi:hypothetical protein
MQGVYAAAKSIRAGRVVTLFNDLGERYMSTHLWQRHE